MAVTDSVAIAGESTGRASHRTIVTAMFSILAVAALLRLPGLDSWPPPLNHDEASRLYDAWCLLETGRDRHGEFLPLMLRSFGEGDYTAALTTWLTVPFVAVMGPTATAARLPDALLGVVTVGLVFGFVRRFWSAGAALAAAGAMATDPAHIFLCRTAHESGFAPFFLMSALYAFERAGLLREKDDAAGEASSSALIGWSGLSGVMFGLHAWVYPATRLFTPLFLIALAFVYFRGWRSGRGFADPRRIAAGIAGLVVGMSPLWITAITDPGRIAARRGVTIWAQPAFTSSQEKAPYFCADHLETTGTDAGHCPRCGREMRARTALNLAATLCSTILTNYARNFSTSYYFIRADEMSGTTIEGVGRHLIVLAPIWLLGLVLILRSTRERRTSRLLVAWLILFPLPAAICIDWNPHPFRTVAGMPLFPIIAGIGGDWCLGRVPSSWRVRAIVVMLLAITINTAYVFNAYIRRSAGDLAYGYQRGLVEAMRFAGERAEDADFVLVTRWFNQPYIYALIYAPIEPRTLAKLPTISGPDLHGFHQINRIGPFFFPPRAPEETPALTNEFQAVFAALPPDAEGLVIELAGRFPAGELLATFSNGMGPNVEVRRWRRNEPATEVP